MADLHPALAVLAALVPSAGVGFLFWLALRAIIGADRRERAALARLDRAENPSSAAEGSHPIAPDAPEKRD